MILAFAEHGADVIIASRKLPACEEVAAEVEKRFGRRAFPVACNSASSFCTGAVLALDGGLA